MAAISKFSKICTDNCHSLTLTQSPTSAILTTTNKTYALRQKNTSNALILLSPLAPEQGSTQTEVGIGAVATIHETVELEVVHQPVSGNKMPHTGSRGRWHERFGRGR